MSTSHFCGNIDLPPTSGPHPIDSEGIYHYQGCCHKYDTLMKEIKKNRIMIEMYEFKINGWKCPHDEAFYVQQKIDNEKKYQDKYQHIPDHLCPPRSLIFRFNYPDCCISHTNPDFRNYINKIPYEINDALNDPETIEKFNQLYPNF